MTKGKLATSWARLWLGVPVFFIMPIAQAPHGMPASIASFAPDHWALHHGHAKCGRNPRPGLASWGRFCVACRHHQNPFGRRWTRFPGGNPVQRDAAQAHHPASLADSALRRKKSRRLAFRADFVRSTERHEGSNDSTSVDRHPARHDFCGPDGPRSNRSGRGDRRIHEPVLPAARSQTHHRDLRVG